ncbi:deoxyribonuclease IV [Bacteroidales bacterium OttesenSCG-928-K03]|nr:deoxyribonuclease IV [Bacteroidales bacterium OttesenSCG-928-K03]
MFYIGCHLSSSKGFLNMGEEALSIGANVFQFFTRNPRGGKAKDIDESDVQAYINFSKAHNFGQILAHAPYTLNPCSAEKHTRDFALMILKDDLERMEYVPGNMYNLHPGSHVGQGVEKGIELTVDALNSVIKENQRTTVLIETMSGKGSELGGNFEEIKQIIDGINIKKHIGVCLDTCHISDAGYDIVNNLDKVLDDFDRIVGLDKLKAIHLNDSMNIPGSHKDRHQKIGEGTLGIETFSSIINHPALEHLPFYLETPNELDGYKKEISLLKKLYM